MKTDFVLNIVDSLKKLKRICDQELRQNLVINYEAEKPERNRSAKKNVIVFWY